MMSFPDVLCGSAGFRLFRQNMLNCLANISKFSFMVAKVQETPFGKPFGILSEINQIIVIET